MIREARPSRMPHRFMVSAACVLFFTMPAHAQDAPETTPQADSETPAGDASVNKPANKAPGTDDIIVTARRVRESQQRVPIAITTFSQEALDRNQIRSLTDLQQFVPSAAVSGYNSRNQEWFTLRGQGQTGLETGGGVGGGPAVVGYLAEVPVNIAGPGLYYDLASLQVLKGPQGTLFGRNTTGGAILFEPNKPTDKFDAGVSVTLGSFARHEAQGFLNIPLADGLAIRFAGQLGHRKGYTTDALTGDRYQTRNYESARIGLQFDRGAFSNYLLGSYTNYRESGAGNVLLFVRPGNPALEAALATQQELGRRRTQHSLDNEKDTGKFLTVINQSALELSDTLRLRNIASFTHYRTLRRVDEDGTAIAYFDSTGPLPGTYHREQDVFTEELQLQGKYPNDALTWQVGAYYEDAKNPKNNTFSQHLFDSFYLNSYRIDRTNTSKGLYAQATVAIAPTLKATAGYRHTWDKVGFGFAQTFSGGPLPADGDFCTSAAPPGPVFYPDENCFVSDSTKDNGSSYTLGLDWQVRPSTLLYFVTRQGYKSGGFNMIAVTRGATGSDFYRFRPERVRDAEVGLKTDWHLGGGRGRSNIAVYWSKYKDVQALTAAQIGAGVEGVTVNAASATIWGIEAENSYRPTPNVDLNLTYSYTNAGYDRYVTPLGTDLSDSKYPNTPKHKLAAGARFRLPVPSSSGELWAGGTYSFQDDMYVGIGDNGPGSPANTQAGYGLVNLRADWYNVMGSKFDASAWVTNVTDKKYLVTTLDLYNALGFAVGTYGEPRMYGVTLQYSY